MPAKTKLTGRQALVQVLRTCTACGAVAEEGATKCESCGTKLGSRKLKELTAEAARLAKGLRGKTPEATLAATLAVDAKKDDGLFVRPPGTKATFDLRERVGRGRRARAGS